MSDSYETLNQMLENKEFVRLRNALVAENPVDIAAFIESLPEDKSVLIFRMLPKDMAADVFANLFYEEQQSIIELLSDREIALIVNDLYADDAVDFIEEMPAGVAKKVLANASKETREQINHLLRYPENSAGSIMTVEYVDLDRAGTVEEAFARIRKTGTDKETIYTCYVTDAFRHLEGIASIRKLLLSPPDALIADIMDTHIISARTSDDQEAVAHLFDRYDQLSVPVVDTENRLVGIITVDDVMDVVREETTEDFEKMAAMHPSEKPYLKSGVFSLFRNRIVWLIVLMISAMITGSIIEHFEDAIAAITLLAAFTPMLTDTGGNAGSQSSTMVIRGMALREIKSSDFLRVLWKELRVGLMCAVVLSVINFIRISLQYSVDEYPQKQMIALTVSVSLFITIILAKTLGGLLPIAAKKLRLDPAVMASPLITTIVDAVSLIVYFLIAQRLLAL